MATPTTSPCRMEEDLSSPQVVSLVTDYNVLPVSPSPQLPFSELLKLAEFPTNFAKGD